MNEALKSICDSMLSMEQSGGLWSEPQRDVARIFLGIPPVSQAMQGVTVAQLIGKPEKAKSSEPHLLEVAAIIASSGISEERAADKAWALRCICRRMEGT